MSWLTIAFAIPVFVVLQDGSTYLFAFSLSGAGLLFYFINIYLNRWFIAKHAPSTLRDDTWEHTAGTGIVPKWVSALGHIGMGFIPSGFVVGLLLVLGFVVNRA